MERRGRTLDKIEYKAMKLKTAYSSSHQNKFRVGLVLSQTQRRVASRRTSGLLPDVRHSQK